MNWLYTLISLILVSNSFAANPLSSSVLLFGESDYKTCSELVERAATFGNKRLNFMVSVNVHTDSKARLLDYCLSGNLRCEKLNPELSARLESYLEECFRTASRRGLEIAILPHIDDASYGLWRNQIQFDPLADYEGASYLENFLKPIALALAQSVPEDRQIYFALQGEMGTSLFGFPDSYRTTLKTIRQILPRHRGLHLGVSVNFNSVLGGRVPPHFDNGLAQNLLDDCDFLGISNYHPVNVPVAAADFMGGIHSVLNELKRAKLSWPKTKEIQFSEIGIGGATAAGKPAKDPQEAAQSPWSGNATENVWLNLPLRDFRRGFYNSLLDFLDQPLEGYTVSGAYIWNSGTWDPQGLRPDGVPFADPAIAQAIRDHNSR